MNPSRAFPFLQGAAGAAHTMEQGLRFLHRHTIRFGEIDYAGIVYYPNFFDFFQQTEEEFMGQLGYPYHHLLGTLKRGFPIVHAEADFKVPVRYGDELDIELTVVHLGTASVAFRFRAHKAEGAVLCAEATIVHALIDTVRFEPIPIPPDMRQQFERYRAPRA